MTQPPPLYGDVAALLVHALTTADVGGEITTRRPADLATRVPLTVVSVFGGAEINPAQEHVRFDLDHYVGPDVDGNPDDTNARLGAEALRRWVLRDAIGFTWTDPEGITMTITNARGISRPTERPYDDDSPIVRYGAAYGLKVTSRG